MTTTSHKCVARAQYDNIADSPDELAFRKGDVLTVFEQNTGGLEGWWLCSLRGRQGICPGNRVRLLPGIYDTGQGVLSQMTTPTDHTSNQRNLSQENGTLMQQGKRRSWDINPNKVMIPQKVGDVYMYEIPPSCKQNDMVFPDYDVPPTKHTTAALNTSRNGSNEILNFSLIECNNGVHSRVHSNVSAVRGKGRRTPTPISDGDSYDIPRPVHVQISDESDTYDVPRNHSTPSQRTPQVIPQSNRSSGVSFFSQASSQLSPSSSSASSLSLSLSNRSSLEHAASEVYDIPPCHQPIVECEYDVPRANSSTNIIEEDCYDIPRKVATTAEGVYDVPPQVMRDTIPRRVEENSSTQVTTVADTDDHDVKELLELSYGKELPLELSSAVDTLVKLQQELHSSITKLLAFVKTDWRHQQNFEPKVYEIKLSIVRLRSSLQEFVEFSQGALVNATKVTSLTITGTLAQKLFKLIKPLLEANELVQRSSTVLDDFDWSVLSRKNEPTKPDDLDQVVTCSKNLTEDVRQVASFIQGHSTLLFKRAVSIVDSPSKKSSDSESIYANDGKGWVEDYDYVSLESKATLDKANDQIKESLPKDLRKSFENLIRESHVHVDSDLKQIDINDRQVLQFYSSQAAAHVDYLRNAIDAFFNTIEKNQPPKIFVAHSKFIVVGAHKLVYIGDTVHHNIVSPDIRNRVIQCSNKLCDGLKATVAATKKAAIEFPSVSAVQDMIDAVVEVSHLASDLKLATEYNLQ